MHSELKQHLKLNLQWNVTLAYGHMKKCYFELATNKWVKKKNEKKKKEQIF